MEIRHSHFDTHGVCRHIDLTTLSHIYCVLALLSPSEHLLQTLNPRRAVVLGLVRCLVLVPRQRLRVIDQLGSSRNVIQGGFGWVRVSSSARRSSVSIAPNSCLSASVGLHWYC